jgi:hypothetical protein
VEIVNRYRFLLYVLAIALFAAYWEVTDPQVDKSLQQTPPGYPEVIGTMYPDREDSLFLQAMQARTAGNLSQARELFERAISTGVKTDENLYYEYLATLIEMDAEQADVDAAAKLWRTNYPFSKKPYPRKAEPSSTPSQPAP